jgi:hypothetical protein
MIRVGEIVGSILIVLGFLELLSKRKRGSVGWRAYTGAAIMIGGGTLIFIGSYLEIGL